MYLNRLCSSISGPEIQVDELFKNGICNFSLFTSSIDALLYTAHWLSDHWEKLSHLYHDLNSFYEMFWFRSSEIKFQLFFCYFHSLSRINSERMLSWWKTRKIFNHTNWSTRASDHFLFHLKENNKTI